MCNTNGLSCCRWRTIKMHLNDTNTYGNIDSENWKINIIRTRLTYADSNQNHASNISAVNHFLFKSVKCRYKVGTNKKKKMHSLGFVRLYDAVMYFDFIFHVCPVNWEQRPKRSTLFSRWHRSKFAKNWTSREPKSTHSSPKPRCTVHEDCSRAISMEYHHWICWIPINWKHNGELARSCAKVLKIGIQFHSKSSL